MAAALLCGAALLGAVAAGQARLVAMGYQLQRLQVQVRAEQAEVERLRAQWAQLRAPERVDRVARYRLGLREAERLALAEVPPLPVVELPPAQGGRAVTVPVQPAGSAQETERPSALEVLAQGFYRWLAGAQAVEAHPVRELR